MVVLSDQQEIDRILSVMPIGDLWGIGRRLTKRLYSRRIHHRRFRQPSPDVGQVQTGRTVRNPGEIHGEKLHRIRLQETETPGLHQRVAHVSYRYRRFRLHPRKSGHLLRPCLGKRLRIQGGECGKVTVFLRSNRFHTENGYEAPDGSIDFEKRVSDEPTQ